MSARFDRALTAVAAASVGLLSVALCVRKIWAADFWWQRRTGEYVLEHGWPAGDVFSYTVNGAPWIELRWLFCVTQSVLAQSLGPSSLILVKWLVVAAAFLLLARPWLRGHTLAPALGLLTLALLASSQRLAVRPEIVTWLGIAVFARVLDRHRLRVDRRIWILPLLQVVWVNSHTLFVFGPLLVGLMFVASAFEERTALGAGGARRNAALARLGEISGVGVATGLACLLNPWALRGATFPWRLFTEIRGTAFKLEITEFFGPFAFGVLNPATLAFLALIAISALALVLGYRRLDPFWLGLALVQLYLALLAVRNVPLFALAAVPFCLSCLERSPRLADYRRVVLVGVVVLALPISVDLASNRFYVRQGETSRFGLGLTPERFPIDALAELDRAGLHGRIFAPMHFNSYLVWRERPVFFDPRLEVYGEAWFERFLAAQRDPRAFDRVVDEFDVVALVLPPYAPLIRVARDRAHWRLVHFDSVAAVFVRDDAAAGFALLDTPQQIDAAALALADAIPAPHPAGLLGATASARPWLALSDFLITFGAADAAERFLARAESAQPTLPGLDARRSALAELRGDWARAEEIARSGLAHDPDDPLLELQLGTALYAQRRNAEARQRLESAARGLPPRPRIHAMLASLDALDERFEDAARRFALALELDPRNAEYIGNLARMHARLGRTEAATTGLEVALEIDPAELSLRRDLALLYMEAGDRERAARHLEIGLGQAPDDARLRSLDQRLRSTD